MKKILLAVSVLFLSHIMFAQDLDTPVIPKENKDTSALLKVAKTELGREFIALNQEKTKPYYISYYITENMTNRIAASFGKIITNTATHTRNLDVDLRVGSYNLDNSHLIRGNANIDANIGSGALPLDNDEAGLRSAMWLITDRTYRSAIEKYEKILTNQTVKVAAEDTSDDFSKELPTIYKEQLKERRYYNELTRIFFPDNIFPIDTMKWARVCRDLSALFVPHQWLLQGQVTFSTEVTNRTFINTEGTEISYPATYVRMMVQAQTKADDGMLLPLYKSYFAFNTKDIPDIDSIKKDINKMIELLSKLRTAPMATTFSGPAILRGEAAGVFFHEIFGHRVEGFREKDPDASNTFKQMIGKKILPDFMDVVFDPSIKNTSTGENLAGYYLYDDEGVLGQKVVSVKNGIFEKFLMSRCPIEGFPNSNGHGRKSQGRAAVTRQSNLMVVAHKTVPQAQMRQMLIEEAKKQGQEYGLLFVTVEGGFTFTDRYIPNAFNVMPLVVYKIFVDGRPDELVRGIDLIGTPLNTFSNITAAADDLGIFNGVCGAESGWVPVSASSPSLLVSKIEVQKKSKSQSKQPILPSPLESSK